MHSIAQVLMGATQSSAKDISTFNSDPATFLAGLAVRQSSSEGILSLTSGVKVGISLGRSLSDSKKTSVVRTGERVAVKAALKRSTGLITVTNFSNLLTTTPDSVTIGATVFTAQSTAVTLGQATFRAATTTAATATSLAAQINAHATASTLVYAVDNGDSTVTLYSVVQGAATGHDVAVAYTDNGGGNVGITLSGLSAGKLSGGSNTVSDIAYQAIGAKVYFNDVTGEADIAMTGFSTISDAVYRVIELTGINEDGSEISAAVVDMPGGL